MKKNHPPVRPLPATYCGNLNSTKSSSERRIKALLMSPASGLSFFYVSRFYLHVFFFFFSCDFYESATYPFTLTAHGCAAHFKSGDDVGSENYSCNQTGTRNGCREELDALTSWVKVNKCDGTRWYNPERLNKLVLPTYFALNRYR